MGYRDRDSGGGFRSGGGGFRRNFGGPREMHKITCSECGKEAEVPFKPSDDRPVYCRDCFFKKKGITPRKPREESEEESDKSEEVEEETEEEPTEDKEESKEE